MNRKLLLCCMAALVAFAAQAQDRADRQELTDPDSFTMILLGDPQGYTKYDINHAGSSKAKAAFSSEMAPLRLGYVATQTSRHAGLRSKGK